jgi:O-antigen/teichoic acid export membrane protein
MAAMGLGETATRFVAKDATGDPLRVSRRITLVMSVSVGTVLSSQSTALGAPLVGAFSNARFYPQIHWVLHQATKKSIKMLSESSARGASANLPYSWVESGS